MFAPFAPLTAYTSAESSRYKYLLVHDPSDLASTRHHNHRAWPSQLSLCRISAFRQLSSHQTRSSGRGRDIYIKYPWQACGPPHHQSIPALPISRARCRTQLYQIRGRSCSLILHYSIDDLQASAFPRRSTTEPNSSRSIALHVEERSCNKHQMRSLQGRLHCRRRDQRLAR